jgi:DNA-binding PadR family transcriptional regulator
MAHVILGLLLIAPMSYYGLVKAFEAGVSLFYSASSGSIRRALETLLRDGLVEVASVDPGGRGTKTYRVTDTGRERFRAWMTGELTGDLETAALSRLYFLGLLEPAERPLVLRRVVDRASANLAELEAVRERVATVEVPEEMRGLATHQLATLDYGITAHRTAVDWFTRHLARTQEEASRG